MKRNEQETVITYSGADDWVSIYSCIPRDIRHFSKRPNCETVKRGRYTSGDEYAHFRVRMDHWRPELAIRESSRGRATRRDTTSPVAISDGRWTEGTCEMGQPLPASETSTGSRSELDAGGVSA